MSCKKEATYRSELSAKIVLARLSARDRDECRYYWCRKHKGYHMTSQPLKNTDSNEHPS